MYPTQLGTHTHAQSHAALLWEFFLSPLLSWNSLNWEKGCKHVGLGSSIQMTLRPITVRIPLYLKKTSGTKPAYITDCIGKGKSSPQKPDPNWFLYPTGQKLCSSWNVEPQDKAPSTYRIGNLNPTLEDWSCSYPDHPSIPIVPIIYT